MFIAWLLDVSLKVCLQYRYIAIVTMALFGLRGRHELEFIGQILKKELSKRATSQRKISWLNNCSSAASFTWIFGLPGFLGKDSAVQ